MRRPSKTRKLNHVIVLDCPNWLGPLLGDLAASRPTGSALFDIEPSEAVMPVLLKKYLHQNARILGFNRDPKFNNALDGLMLLDVQDLPAQTVENLQREFGLG